ncbi:MAG: hypothetical protein H0V29_10255, partial [Thermoleophilaceae bacterium]|nr:hypothetical protein [Thermoleophilaceae bacterium]
WALGRFQMGCERALDTEALTDYLLALEALVDASDEAGRAGLPLRVAALCAEESERRAAQRRLEQALAMQRSLISGDGAVVGADSPRSIAEFVENCARGLLRDVLCGYLEPGLRGVADDMLLRTGEPFEITAKDIRAEPEPEPEPISEGTVPLETEPELEFEPEPVTVEEPQLSVEPDDDAGVTPSEDWAWDEDPSSYSAPV